MCVSVCLCSCIGAVASVGEALGAGAGPYWCACGGGLSFVHVFVCVYVWLCLFLHPIQWVSMYGFTSAAWACRVHKMGGGSCWSPYETHPKTGLLCGTEQLLLMV